jgi:glycosyltransferase involved in cell wall biosynthesis
MKRPRRLLSIAHSYVVANNRKLVHEMARVSHGRWEVTAVAPTYFHGGNDLRPVHLERLAAEPCPLREIPAYLTRQVHVFLYGRRLRRLLGDGWDLVHCWEEPYVLAGGQVAWWTPPRVPLVYRTAQSMPKRYPVPFRYVERWSMRRAAGWVCSGHTVAKALATRPGYAQRPMRRIPLGVDTSAFQPDRHAGAAVRRSLGWAVDGPPVVGFLGRFTAAKGLDLLMRVLERLQGSWRALFVGAGPLEGELRDWAARQGDRVRICTGVVHAAVPAYLNAMDVLCAPSRTTPGWREQFGRMLVEAFACGVPVVGSDSGEIPYVLGDDGLVAGESDEDGWLWSLEHLLSDPVRRRELADRGLERAKLEFDWPLVARSYLDFFEQVLDGPGEYKSDRGEALLSHGTSSSSGHL